MVETESSNDEPPTMTVEEAVVALEKAGADEAAGNRAAAKAGYARLIESGLLSEWAQFFIGRIYRLESDDDSALTAFNKAIEQHPGMFWAHYERLILARENSFPLTQISEYATGIVAIEWETLNAGHVGELEPISHTLWDSDQAELAAKLLERLWPSADLGQLALVRIVEANRDAKIAREAAARLESLPGLDDTTLKVLTDLHQQHGDVDREIAIMEKRRTAAPKDFQTWLALVRAYAKKGDREKALAALDNGEMFVPRQRSFVSVVAHIELADLDIAFHAFRNHARLYKDVPKFPGIRLSYLLSDAFDTVRRDEVLGLLNAWFPNDNDVALVHVNAAIRDQRWEEASALFETHFAAMENKPQNVRLTQIDILAFSGRLDEAAALLDAERVNGVCPPPILRSTLRIFSELDRWDSVFDLGVASLADDSSFEHFLSVIIRAARKTGRSGELFDALMALPRPLKRQQSEALYAVMEDLAEAGETDIIDRIGDVPLPYEREHRIRLKLRGTDGHDPVKKDLCIFYCADKNYLLPALVSLTALAMSNVSIARRAVFNIVVDSDVVPFAKEASGAIAERLGLTVEVVDASTIVSVADKLRTGYGVFTGGQQLALAAYYRIFFARHLAGKGEYAQALYVDADTVVRSGLDELFAADRKAPLMARYEIDRPEVRHAAQVHQLKGRYFNSGVLRFDLTHPDLPELLDRAIAAAIDPEVNLIYQDQCALNIAFDQNMAELPERFNYFNPPSVSGDDISASDAVIVHFLDRPKPWDSLYRRRAREWFEWYDLVESLRLANAPK